MKLVHCKLGSWNDTLFHEEKVWKKGIVIETERRWTPTLTNTIIDIGIGGGALLETLSRIIQHLSARTTQAPVRRAIHTSLTLKRTRGTRSTVVEGLGSGTAGETLATVKHHSSGTRQAIGGRGARTSETTGIAIWRKKKKDVWWYELKKVAWMN